MQHFPGQIIELRYGNGTQAAVVTAISKRGLLTVRRLFGREDLRAPTKLVLHDGRIIGEIPHNDHRAATIRLLLTDEKWRGTCAAAEASRRG